MKLKKYLKKLKLSNGSKEEEKLVNQIFKSISSIPCSVPFKLDSIYTVAGEKDIIKIFDYTYLIPNLFRLCYVQNTLPLPDACINYVNTNITDKYLPYLIPEIYIKSFLYFNFPANHKDYTYLNTFINNIVNLKNYILTKTYNTSYGSYTPGNIFYDRIYSPNSMLTQLMLLNNSLGSSDELTALSKFSCPFDVIWDYLTGCATSNIYLVSKYNDNNILSQETLYNLNYIRYTFFNEFSSTNDLNYNDVLLVYKSNIYHILKYASDVYRDIIEQFNYLIRDDNYCIKDYMNVKNIPVLVKLYNNFLKNQKITFQRRLPVTNAANITPNYITINDYVNNFTIYFNTKKLGTILNTVYINTTEAILLCYDKITPVNPATVTRSSYLYYYINIYSPSAIQLYNYWGISGVTPNYTALTLNDFCNDFLFNGVPALSIEPYLTITGSVATTLKQTIDNAGLYPLPVITTKARIYDVYSDLTKNVLNSKVFLTFQTETNKAIGLSLVFFSN
jgi:hypothetical protein